MREPMKACKVFRENKMEFPCGGQIKYDGIRMVVKDGIALAYSMKPIPSEQVQSLVAHHRDELEGFDGELICGEPEAPDCYRRTMSSVMSFNKPDDDLRFYVFDKWDEPSVYEDRWAVLNEIITPYSPKEVRLAEMEMLYDIEEINLFEIKVLDMGHEGAILRNMSTFYKFGRAGITNSECVKLKRFVDAEARIVDYHEEQENTNEAELNEAGRTKRSGHKDNLIGKGTLGAVEAEGVYEDGTPFTVRIGTGFKADERISLWRERETLIGRIVKFKHFPTGSKEKPRFPVFLGFRHPDDMGAEQLSLL